MQHLKINNSICNGCGYCVTDCPMGILRITAFKVAECVQENVEVCIYCGHCVTVCPVKAIQLTQITDEIRLEWIKQYGIVPLSLKPEDCEISEHKNYPPSDMLRSLFKSRRMIRTYKNKLVDKNILKNILEILKYAPSGHNTRGFKILIVEGRHKLDILTDMTCSCFKDILAEGSLKRFDKEVYARIIYAWEHDRINRIFRTAEEAIIVHCDSNIPPAGTAIISMLTYFEMLANTMGLGTAWAGYFMAAASRYKPIKDNLKIPASNNIYGAMMFGYPGFSYNLIPKRPDLDIQWL